MVTRKNENLTVADWLFWLRKDTLPQDQQDVLHFMFTWMKYNNWYSKKYKLNDTQGAIALSKNRIAQEVYKFLRNDFVHSFKIIPHRSVQGNSLGLYSDDEEKIIASFNSNKNNLYYYLKVVYKIRCNFFHGSKVPSVNNIKLIIWAGQTLDKLLIELKRNGVIDIF